MRSVTESSQFPEGKLSSKNGLIAIGAGIVVGILAYAIDFQALSDGFKAVANGIDLTQLMADRKSYNKLIYDLEEFSGLELGAPQHEKHKHNILTYREKVFRVGFSFNKEKEDRKWTKLSSTAYRRGKGGSPTLRKILVSAIKSKRTVNVTLENLGHGPHSDAKMNVTLDAQVIEKEMKGVRNMDQRTWGWGFAFLHEFFHTTPGGRLTDGPKEEQGTMPGATEQLLNKIRRELGQEFGERLFYYLEGASHIPFDKESYKAIMEGRVPDPKSKYLIITY